MTCRALMRIDAIVRKLVERGEHPSEAEVLWLAAMARRHVETEAAEGRGFGESCE